MLFITYWELNPDFDPAELSQVAQKIISKGLYPSPGVKTIAWMITPGYWGVTISESESEDVIFNDVNMWRIAKPGIFKTVKIAPAMKIEEVLPLMFKLKKKLE